MVLPKHEDRPLTRVPPATAAMHTTLPALLLVLVALALTACHHQTTPAEATADLKQAFPEGGGSDAVRTAVAATEAGDYGNGVIALEAAKSAPGLSGSQLAAMERAAQTLTADLTRRADAGDAAARAQLAAIERMRSQ